MSFPLQLVTIVPILLEHFIVYVGLLAVKELGNFIRKEVLCA